MASESAEDLQKRRALDLVLDAWEKALAAGAEPEVVASVAIYAALADMVDRHGAEAVAEFCATLPERARNGEFTLQLGD
jgi:transcription initiation factor TFIIIB Brf1 subunit/transcription initiation factor TFIIB